MAMNGVGGAPVGGGAAGGGGGGGGGGRGGGGGGEGGGVGAGYSTRSRVALLTLGVVVGILLFMGAVLLGSYCLKRAKALRRKRHQLNDETTRLSVCRISSAVGGGGGGSDGGGGSGTYESLECSRGINHCLEKCASVATDDSGPVVTSQQLKATSAAAQATTAAAAAGEAAVKTCGRNSSEFSITNEIDTAFAQYKQLSFNNTDCSLDQEQELALFTDSSSSRDDTMMTSPRADVTLIGCHSSRCDIPVCDVTLGDGKMASAVDGYGRGVICGVGEALKEGGVKGGAGTRGEGEMRGEENEVTVHAFSRHVSFVASTESGELLLPVEQQQQQQQQQQQREHQKQQQQPPRQRATNNNYQDIKTHSPDGETHAFRAISQRQPRHQPVNQKRPQSLKHTLSGPIAVDNKPQQPLHTQPATLTVKADVHRTTSSTSAAANQPCVEERRRPVSPRLAEIKKELDFFAGGSRGGEGLGGEEEENLGQQRHWSSLEVKRVCAPVDRSTRRVKSYEERILEFRSSDSLRITEFLNGPSNEDEYSNLPCMTGTVNTGVNRARGNAILRMPQPLGGSFQYNPQQESKTGEVLLKKCVDFEADSYWRRRVGSDARSRGEGGISTSAESVHRPVPERVRARTWSGGNGNGPTERTKPVVQPMKPSMSDWKEGQISAVKTSGPVSHATEEGIPLPLSHSTPSSEQARGAPVVRSSRMQSRRRKYCIAGANRNKPAPLVICPTAALAIASTSSVATGIESQRMGPDNSFDSVPTDVDRSSSSDNKVTTTSIESTSTNAASTDSTSGDGKGQNKLVQMRCEDSGYKSLETQQSLGKITAHVTAAAGSKLQSCSLDSAAGATHSTLVVAGEKKSTTGPQTTSQSLETPLSIEAQMVCLSGRASGRRAAAPPSPLPDTCRVPAGECHLPAEASHPKSAPPLSATPLSASFRISSFGGHHSADTPSTGTSSSSGYQSIETPSPNISKKTTRFLFKVPFVFRAAVAGGAIPGDEECGAVSTAEIKPATEPVGKDRATVDTNKAGVEGELPVAQLEQNKDGDSVGSGVLSAGLGRLRQAGQYFSSAVSQAESILERMLSEPGSACSAGKEEKCQRPASSAASVDLDRTMTQRIEEISQKPECFRMDDRKLPIAPPVKQQQQPLQPQYHHQLYHQRSYKRDNFVSEEDRATFQPFRRTTTLRTSSSTTSSSKSEPLPPDTCQNIQQHPSSLASKSVSSSSSDKRGGSTLEMISREVTLVKMQGGTRTASKKRRDYRSRKMIDEIDTVGTPDGEKVAGGLANHPATDACTEDGHLTHPYTSTSSNSSASSSSGTEQSLGTSDTQMPLTITSQYLSAANHPLVKYEKNAKAARSRSAEAFANVTATLSITSYLKKEAEKRSESTFEGIAITSGSNTKETGHNAGAGGQSKGLSGFVSKSLERTIQPLEDVTATSCAPSVEKVLVPRIVIPTVTRETEKCLEKSTPISGGKASDTWFSTFAEKISRKGGETVCREANMVSISGTTGSDPVAQYRLERKKTDSVLEVPPPSYGSSRTLPARSCSLDSRKTLRAGAGALAGIAVKSGERGAGKGGGMGTGMALTGYKQFVGSHESIEEEGEEEQEASPISENKKVLKLS